MTSETSIPKRSSGSTSVSPLTVIENSAYVCLRGW